MPKPVLFFKVDGEEKLGFRAEARIDMDWEVDESRRNESSSHYSAIAHSNVEKHAMGMALRRLGQMLMATGVGEEAGGKR